MSIPVAQAVLRPLGSAIRASDHRRQSRPTLLGSLGTMDASAGLVDKSTPWVLSFGAKGGTTIEFWV
ncbi:hypothetical protein V6N13_050740 [Hibiscus sabdariffa]